MRSVRLILLAAILAVGAWSRAAAAHPVGLSQGEYVYRSPTLFAGVTLARRELTDSLSWMRSDDQGAGLLAFDRHREALGRWLIERLAVSSDGRPCTGRLDGMRFDGDDVAFALSYACMGEARRLDLDARFVSELDRRHRHLAALSIDGEIAESSSGRDRHENVATRAQTLLSFEGACGPATPKSSGVFLPLLRMGIEHILTGYDHLLFLLALVLVGGPLRSLVGAITAFTVAHSITLGVASLGVWTPSAGVVEPSIALSIAYVGVENWFVRDAKGRWRITLLFGLIHGFGFAGALQDIALPRSDVPSALFAFNLGVELGQVAVLALVLPLVLAARKREVWERVGMRACTMTIALAGVVWFIARVRDSM
jgi:hydrogenase/urease accessory protein HupE